jgi:hypothetical protein
MMVYCMYSKNMKTDYKDIIYIEYTFINTHVLHSLCWPWRRFQTPPYTRQYFKYICRQYLCAVQCVQGTMYLCNRMRGLFTVQGNDRGGGVLGDHK